MKRANHTLRLLSCLTLTTLSEKHCEYVKIARRLCCVAPSSILQAEILPRFIEQSRMQRRKPGDRLTAAPHPVFEIADRRYRITVVLRLHSIGAQLSWQLSRTRGLSQCCAISSKWYGARQNVGFVLSSSRRRASRWGRMQGRWSCLHAEQSGAARMMVAAAPKQTLEQYVESTPLFTWPACSDVCMAGILMPLRCRHSR
jgi:hypothetical protein